MDFDTICFGARNARDHGWVGQKYSAAAVLPRRFGLDEAALLLATSRVLTDKGGQHGYGAQRSGTRHERALAQSSTRSSSALASPVCINFTGCASSACGSGPSKRAARSAAPGTGTAIRARAWTRKAGRTATRSRRSLLEEWEWEEHFSAQPHTERYLNYVADKFDLRRDIQFNSRVVAAHWREETRSWELVLESGARHSTRFLVTAIGVLSAAVMPTIPGIESFTGQSCHTQRWPKDGIELAGKRVGIIGTGATAVQTIQTIAKTVGHLTVFQRTPNWCFPLNNSKITPEEMRDIRARYPEILARCRETPSCYVHGPDPRKTLEVTPEDREAFWEKLYRTPGFGQWQANFSDMLTDREANALASEFAARKIRERVNDPVVAEKLIPKNHGFGTRRIPLEAAITRSYNQPNVELVDVNETPIERITPRGIRTSDREREFDIIIYATGFDAITGAFDRIDISGVDGVRLKEVWKDGPQTYLGVFVDRVSEFPDGDGSARRAQQLHAHRGIQRRMGHRRDPVCDRARTEAHRGHAVRRRRMDQSRPGPRPRPADE